MKIYEIEKSGLADLLPLPSAVANKYSRGKLVCIGGSAEYPGAICLAAHAAERMGAGYVEVFCAPNSASVVHSTSLSLVVRDWDAFDVEKTSLAHFSDTKPQACLVGSGFSGSDFKEPSLLFDVLEGCTHPVCIDGAAIGYLATEEGIKRARFRAQRRQEDSASASGAQDRFSLVVTPHAGEAARLASAASIDLPTGLSQPIKLSCLEDEFEDQYCQEMAHFALRLANAYHATIVLKGPDTFVTSPGNEEVAIMRFGSAALSKAGTGDVLAGMVASLLAQGVSPMKAGVLGSSLHALSGGLASESLSEICVCAEDIICFLPEIITSLLTGVR